MGNAVRTATEARRRAEGRPTEARQPSRGRQSRRTESPPLATPGAVRKVRRADRTSPTRTGVRVSARAWEGIAESCQPDNKVALGFVEGLNNRIRVVQRRCYGIRDEEYLRLKGLTSTLPPLPRDPNSKKVTHTIPRRAIFK